MNVLDPADVNPEDALLLEQLANEQRARLAQIPPLPKPTRSAATLPQKQLQSPLRRSKSSAFMPPRRPHNLPPLERGSDRQKPGRSVYDGTKGMPPSASEPVIKTHYESSVEAVAMKTQEE